MISVLRIVDNLPFISLKIHHGKENMELKNVIIDTGSASSILKLDLVETIGIKAEPHDILVTIRGVGGSEPVYFKTIDTLEISDIKVENVQVDIGVMDYGFDIDGIMGMDLLLRMKSVIDLDKLEIVCRL